MLGSWWPMATAGLVCLGAVLLTPAPLAKDRAAPAARDQKLRADPKSNLLDLPSRADTNGSLLAAQAKYALVLDMITRQESVWPRYGTVPGCVSPRGSNCSNPRRTRIACRPPSPAVTVRSHM